MIDVKSMELNLIQNSKKKNRGDFYDSLVVDISFRYGRSMRGFLDCRFMHYE